MTDLSQYLRPAARPSRMTWIIAIALFAGAVWAALEAGELHDEYTRVAVAIERLQEHEVVLERAKPTATDLEEKRKWQTLKEERDFPWEQLLLAVTRASKTDIALLELLPDKRSRSIVLRGEARDAAALLAYLNRLESQRRWTNVHLLHQRKEPHERLETVAFEIKATF
jgi:hypothetical protein